MVMLDGIYGSFKASDICHVEDSKGWYTSFRDAKYSLGGKGWDVETGEHTLKSYTRVLPLEVWRWE